MTDAELEELERLASAATCGPWTVYRCNSAEDDEACGIRSPDNRSEYGADVFQDAAYDECHHIVAPADAHMIAAAREAIPRLIAEVRRLRPIEVEWAKWKYWLDRASNKARPLEAAERLAEAVVATACPKDGPAYDWGVYEPTEEQRAAIDAYRKAKEVG